MWNTPHAHAPFSKSVNLPFLVLILPSFRWRLFFSCFYFCFFSTPLLGLVPLVFHEVGSQSLNGRRGHGVFVRTFRASAVAVGPSRRRPTHGALFSKGTDPPDGSADGRPPPPRKSFTECEWRRLSRRGRSVSYAEIMDEAQSRSEPQSSSET